MRQFDALPAVPLSYRLLAGLSPEEIDQARAAAYVADGPDAGMVERHGEDYCDEPPAGADVRRWRTRMCAIWFCYLVENFSQIAKPLYAIEELILEFPEIEALDLPGRRLATLYAGAGGFTPPSPADRAHHLATLEPHYIRAITMLDDKAASTPS